jgi:hypothetical protein
MGLISPRKSTRTCCACSDAAFAEKIAANQSSKTICLQRSIYFGAGMRVTPNTGHTSGRNNLLYRIFTRLLHIFFSNKLTHGATAPRSLFNTIRTVILRFSDALKAYGREKHKHQSFRSCCIDRVMTGFSPMAISLKKLNDKARKNQSTFLFRLTPRLNANKKVEKMRFFNQSQKSTLPKTN